MRVLFDQGTPAPLRGALTAHVVSTAYEMGWSALSNGDLLDAVEAQFDAFVTTDQNLRHQQNLAGVLCRVHLLGCQAPYHGGGASPVEPVPPGSSSGDGGDTDPPGRTAES